MTANYVVEQVAHDVAPGKWETTLWLSPASVVLNHLIIDDATYGAIDAYPISN
jgi:hypothetical protein